jgi:hypothetical protein
LRRPAEIFTPHALSFFFDEFRQCLLRQIVQELLDHILENPHKSRLAYPAFFLKTGC